MVDMKKYINLIHVGMEHEMAVEILKRNGADQMTSVKVIREVFGLKLREADKIVQDSIHWQVFKEGNENLKNRWFDSELE